VNCFKKRVARKWRDEGKVKLRRVERPPRTRWGEKKKKMPRAEVLWGLALGGGGTATAISHGELLRFFGRRQEGTKTKRGRRAAEGCRVTIYAALKKGKNQAGRGEVGLSRPGP